ncbi:MAG: ABC transporter permease [Actinobacteria bacterium]|jgi:D-xylose transport system permease protein|nr:MAG: ABC transporter permease [Actinomycetota bacterium]
MSSTLVPDTETPAQDSPGIGESLHNYWDRVRGGDLGSLPAVAGLIALIIVFTALQGDTFLSAFNFANLINQSAMIIVLAMGLIFVLLLGEIDLSAGFAAGTCAAVLGVTLTEKGWPLLLALAATLLTGVVIGVLIGVLVAKLGIPSFVVTLAMFLALQGLMLLIIGEGGTIGIDDPAILNIMNANMSPLAGWILFAIVVGGWALLSLNKMRSRRASGLPTENMSVFLAKLIALAVILGFVVYILNQERSRNPAVTSIVGVPYVVPLILILVVGLTYLLSRTGFGRHVYAVGGNAEASRRAGISVSRIKIACFIACSTLAAVAGILFASRDNSISPSTGGSTTLLYAVGAAVIGGTSLFGGRGRIIDAVIGGLVVGVIANGLPLITQQSGISFIVTGLVLLVAASVDALSRRRAMATGRV